MGSQAPVAPALTTPLKVGINLLIALIASKAPSSFYFTSVSAAG